MKNFRFFNTTGYNGSATVVDLGEQTTVLGTGHCYLYPTYDKAFTAVTDNGDDGEPDVVAPVPPMVVDGVQYGFFDSAGFINQRVDITLGAKVALTNDVKICGGAYRLRFIGNGTYNFNYGASYLNTEFEDVDFVKLTGICGGSNYGKHIFRRCFVGGCDTFYTNFRTITIYDSVVVCNKSPLGAPQYTSAAYRSTLDVDSCYASNWDVTNHSNLVLSNVANAFVTSPKIADSANSGCYTDGTAWTNTDWGSIDLRLLSTATTYQAGNGLTSSDLPVYDLAGLPRGVNGSLGAYAYEATSDVNAVYCAVPNNIRYVKITTEEGSPKITAAYAGNHTSVNKRTNRWCFKAVFDGVATSAGKIYCIRTSGDLTQYGSFAKGATAAWIGETYPGYNTYALYYVDDDGQLVGNPTTLVFSSAPSEGCVPAINPNVCVFENATSKALITPTSDSIALIEKNIEFANLITEAQFGKIVLPGWTHIDLSNAEIGDVVCGKETTITSCGKIALKNKTITDAELWQILTLESGATLTLEDCTTTDV